jgi:hypothetical protein
VAKFAIALASIIAVFSATAVFADPTTGGGGSNGGFDGKTCTTDSQGNTTCR